MRLSAKRLVMLVCDGVDEQEYEQLRRAFEDEGARVLVTSPQPYGSVESLSGPRRGRDVLIDLPFEAVSEYEFDGLILPEGLLAVEEMRKDSRVLDLIFSFHQAGLPIFASGSASQLLYASRVLSEQILVREGTAMDDFVDQAVGVLLDRPLVRVPRPSM
jgi:protease I